MKRARVASGDLPGNIGVGCWQLIATYVGWPALYVGMAQTSRAWHALVSTCPCPMVNITHAAVARRWVDNVDVRTAVSAHLDAVRHTVHVLNVSTPRAGDLSLGRTLWTWCLQFSNLRVLDVRTSEAALQWPSNVPTLHHLHTLCVHSLVVASDVVVLGKMAPNVHTLKLTYISGELFRLSMGNFQHLEHVDLERYQKRAFDTPEWQHQEWDMVAPNVRHLRIFLHWSPIEVPSASWYTAAVHLRHVEVSVANQDVMPMLHALARAPCARALEFVCVTQYLDILHVSLRDVVNFYTACPNVRNYPLHTTSAPIAPGVDLDELVTMLTTRGLDACVLHDVPVTSAQLNAIARCMRPRCNLWAWYSTCDMPASVDAASLAHVFAQQPKMCRVPMYDAACLDDALCKLEDDTYVVLSGSRFSHAQVCTVSAATVARLAQRRVSVSMEHLVQGIDVDAVQRMCQGLHIPGYISWHLPENSPLGLRAGVGLDGFVRYAIYSSSVFVGIGH